jgi:transposase
MEHSERLKVLSSERYAKSYYKRLRWKDCKRFCLGCGRNGLLILSDGRYKCRFCGVRFNDFTQTYLSGLKLGFRQVAWLVYYFSLELSARRSAKELGVNYKTAYRFFELIRGAIVRDDCLTGLCGEVELDETYVGGRRKGKRGRGASGKVPVFGMLERSGKIVVEAVPDVKEETLMALVTENIEPGSLTYSDGFKSYRSLLVNGYEHVRIDHEKEFANGKVHINGIEGFWSYTKERLAKYHGVSPRKLYLYLKELEFRFNNRQVADLFELISSQLVQLVRCDG